MRSLSYFNYFLLSPKKLNETFISIQATGIKMKLIPATILLLNTLLDVAQSFRNIQQIGASFVSQMKHNTGTPLMATREVMPDKCEVKLYIQKIRKQRCQPLDVPNTFCSGVCNSVHIPGRRAVLMQKTCKATKTVRERIRLECPGRKKKWRYVSVTRALDCGCTDCSSS